ncbi:type I-E CRISPR-associated endoribonuclease Cas2e [Corynebacterium nuruki]|jgi:CRISPR-associated protein Cas2|uniref:Type I-E CRISPR-associated endoribonuclease Cas2 n=2 Tax=Corynebacterium nuruki TaxID=1032851 RepID=A0A3D4SW61_9CORY|nr:type I-E CRISPR-associated endoribonuclease Cas2 [Corynebacterium nuruki]
MMTLVLSASPAQLRGQLTRWLMEVSPGVYVGRVSARVREELWLLVTSNMDSGRAVMTYPTNKNEQGFVVEVHRGQWTPVDIEGMTLMKHPLTTEKGAMKAGWSRASRLRKAARRRRN